MPAERRTIRKSASDSTATVKQLAADLSAPIPYPPGIAMEPGAIATAYAALWQMRAASDWNPAELLMLHRLASTECALREEETTLEAEGHALRGPKGRVMVNPRVQIVEALWRKQVTYWRALGLQTTRSAGTGYANRRAMQRTIASGMTETPGGPDMSLIPRG